jgi:excisionase family DNA binding protein
MPALGDPQTVPLLSPRTAAQVLGVEVGAVHAWVKEGRLPAATVPGRPSRTRIRFDDLERFIAEAKERS